MTKIGLAFAWLRRWGAWLVFGVLLAAVGVLALMLRAANQRTKARALVEKVAALDRAAAEAYDQARAEYEAETLRMMDAQIAAIRDTMARADEEAEHAIEETEDLKGDELADALNRRIPGPPARK